MFGIREFVFILAGGVAGNDDMLSARAWTFTRRRTGIGIDDDIVNSIFDRL